MFEGRLRELGAFSPERRRPQGELIKCVRVSHKKEGGSSECPVAGQEKTKREIPPVHKGTGFSREGGHTQTRLPRNSVDAPCLEIPKTRQDAALSSLR